MRPYQLTVGFLAGLASYTILGHYSLAIMSGIYGLALYRYFFRPAVGRPGLFLVGLTLAGELFSTYRFGYPTATAAVVILIHYGLGERIRLIPRFARYCFGLGILLFFYTLPRYGLGNLTGLISFLLPIWTTVILAAYLAHYTRKPSTYEPF